LNGSHACNDPVQGPTEIDAHSQADMGLSDEDILALTQGWLETMTAAQEAILANGGYTWSLIPGQSNANAMPLMLNRDLCASTIRPSCQPSTPYAKIPLLFGLSMGNSTNPLPFLQQELAAFLLMRGPCMENSKTETLLWSDGSHRAENPRQMRMPGLVCGA
jgi:hypothetical protein